MYRPLAVFLMLLFPMISLYSECTEDIEVCMNTDTIDEFDTLRTRIIFKNNTNSSVYILIDSINESNIYQKAFSNEYISSYTRSAIFPDSIGYIYIRKLVKDEWGDRHLNISFSLYDNNHSVKICDTLIYVCYYVESNYFPILKIEQTQIDLGNLKPNMDTTIQVQIKNIGNRDLVLYSFVSNQTVLKVAFSSDTISPNSEGYLTIQVHTNSQTNIKNWEKKIRIISNSINSPSDIHLTAKIE